MDTLASTLNQHGSPPNVQDIPLTDPHAAYDAVVHLVQDHQLDEAQAVAMTIRPEHVRAQALKLCHCSRLLA
jgi:hypothetical protein